MSSIQKIFSLLIYFSLLIPIQGYGEKIKIEKILSIRGENLEVPFTEIKDVSVDKKGNIYLLDSIGGRIYQFDKEGNFKQIIGKSKFNLKGKNELIQNAESLKKRLEEEGVKPYELLFPQKFYLKEDKLYILDNGKVCIYSIENQFAGSFSFDYINGREIFVNVKDEVVIGGIKRDSNEVFHVFDKEGKYKYSFADYFEIPPKFISSLPRDFDSKIVSFPIYCFYFERDDKYYLMNPFRYEIKIYKDRELEKIIKNERASYMPPQVIISKIGGKNAGGSVGYISPPKIFRLNDHIFVFRLDFDESNEVFSHVDVFKNDILTGSYSLNTLLSPLYLDDKGYLYCEETSDHHKILTKYSFQFLGD